jgi:glycosyltransferase involved in cell wall biosynthesis
VNVLLASASFRSAYGGPAYSVSRLAAALATAGARTGIWAPDGSAPDLESDLGGVVRLAGDLESAIARFGSPGIVHDSGIWLPHNHALAIWAARRRVPRVVSTRGMLEPWARRHKVWKKRIAWASYQRRDLRSAHLLHATSEPEAQNLRALDLGPVEIIPNGVELPVSLPPRTASADGLRTALFLGRIYPVKGLPMLVEAWSQVRPRGWRLEIAGPDEGGHQAEVASLVRRAGLEEVIRFRGPLSGSAKRETLATADLFVLPSHSESFGIVVAEALGHATAVLTTTAAPWPQIEAHNAGWRVTPTVSGLAAGLQLATSTRREGLWEMGHRGRELVLAEYGWDRIAARFIRCYEQLGADPSEGHQWPTRAA